MLQKVIKRDGWYRFRVRAGASRGSGKFAVDAVRIQVDYCPQSRELRRSFTFTIDAPLDQPQVYEQTVFLRRGGDGFNPELRFRWNIYHPWRGFHDDGGELIRTDPEMRRLYWAGRQSRRRVLAGPGNQATARGDRRGAARNGTKPTTTCTASP